MRKWLTMFLVGCLMLGLSACGGNSTTSDVSDAVDSSVATSTTGIGTDDASSSVGDAGSAADTGSTATATDSMSKQNITASKTTATTKAKTTSAATTTTTATTTTKAPETFDPLKPELRFFRQSIDLTGIGEDIVDLIPCGNKWLCLTKSGWIYEICRDGLYSNNKQWWPANKINEPFSQARLYYPGGSEIYTIRDHTGTSDVYYHADFYGNSVSKVGDVVYYKDDSIYRITYEEVGWSEKTQAPVFERKDVILHQFPAGEKIEYIGCHSRNDDQNNWLVRTNKGAYLLKEGYVSIPSGYINVPATDEYQVSLEKIKLETNVDLYVTNYAFFGMEPALLTKDGKLYYDLQPIQ